MKFIVSSSQLLKQLQSISGILNSNNTLPILDNFLFEIKSNKLIVSASDLETTMTTEINNTEASEEGSIAIPSKLLLDILKTFSDQPLTFLINKENFGIEIGSDNGNYKLVGQNGEEFPKSPILENPSKTVINSKVLLEAINKTIFATGNDELRPIMSGVLLEIGNNILTFVATDAHKLVKYSRAHENSDQIASFILPKKPLTLLKNNLDLDEQVKIDYNNTNAHFQFGNIKLVCRLIDGNYPNYNAVIPNENPNILTIERILFLNAVKRVSIFANKSTHQIKLKIAGKELIISSEDLDFSNEAQERLNCEYNGQDIEIGFNSKFLMEMLNNLNSNNVNLEMSTPNRAGILIPQDQQEEGEDTLMLVMPVMLNQ